jgi:ABC-type amino acid transport substrate-binding protein
MKFWKFVSAPVAATLWAISLVLQAIAEPPASNELRVAADPNNLPFSNRARQGFDNALAEMVAKDLRRPLRYIWWPERRGFLRNTLKAGRCDVVRPNPPAALIEAVARGDVDVGVAWGPLAGYFAHRAGAALVVTPVAGGMDGPDTPFVFGVAIGVRREDAALRDSIDRILTRRAPDIDRLLRRYDVPLVAATR